MNSAFTSAASFLFGRCAAIDGGNSSKNRIETIRIICGFEYFPLVVALAR
jgi:hypothetical protein